MNHKSAIRRAMRTRRQQQTQRDLDVAAQRFLRLGRRLLAHHRRVAFFMPFDGEPNIVPLQRALKRAGHHIALPKIARKPPLTMRFVELTTGGKLKRNRFNIAESVDHRHCPLATLDAILLPLTAFDGQGNRLGMGAGFYDRALQSRRGKLLRRPRLIGVAYHWQEIASLPTDPWDLPLHVILTDKKIIRVR